MRLSFSLANRKIEFSIVGRVESDGPNRQCHAHLLGNHGNRFFRNRLTVLRGNKRSFPITTRCHSVFPVPIENRLSAPRSRCTHGSCPTLSGTIIRECPSDGITTENGSVSNGIPFRIVTRHVLLLHDSHINATRVPTVETNCENPHELLFLRDITLI